MKTVLVVDDSIIIQKSIDISLSHSDVNVVYASSAGEAWEKSQQHLVDLFILDVSMPDKNGLELCKELRSLPQYLQTPVIMLASAQNPLDQTELEKIGAQDFILKPFETSEISEKVHGYLNHLSSPPTRDEESFFTPKYSPTPVQNNTPSSHSDSSTSTSYDIGFSSVDDISLTDAEVNIQAISEDNIQETLHTDSSPEISDFAFDNSDLSGIDANSNLDSIADSNSIEYQELDLSTPNSESTDINFDDHGIAEAYADSFYSQPEAKNIMPTPLNAESHEQMISADPVETDVIEPGQNTEAYPSDHPNLESLDNTPDARQSSTPANNANKLQLSDQQIESIVTKVFENVIERIAWEVVPDIAEKMIREEISRLTKD